MHSFMVNFSLDIDVHNNLLHSIIFEGLMPTITTGIYILWLKIRFLCNRVDLRSLQGAH